MIYRSKTSSKIYEKVTISSGILLYTPDPYKDKRVGKLITGLVHFSDSEWWEPCDDPRPAQKSKRLLSALRKLNDQEQTT